MNEGPKEIWRNVNRVISDINEKEETEYNNTQVVVWFGILFSPSIKPLNPARESEKTMSKKIDRSMTILGPKWDQGMNRGHQGMVNVMYKEGKSS